MAETEPGIPIRRQRNLRWSNLCPERTNEHERFRLFCVIEPNGPWRTQEVMHESQAAAPPVASVHQHVRIVDRQNRAGSETDLRALSAGRDKCSDAVQKRCPIVLLSVDIDPRRSEALILHERPHEAFRT